MCELTWIMWWFVGLHVFDGLEGCGFESWLKYVDLLYFYIFIKWWKNLETVEIPCDGKI